jgi:predicted permease
MSAPFEGWISTLAWRQAWRSLARRPAFLAASVLTFAAGTALTAAVFSLVDGVLLKPLPFPDAGQLVTVYESSPSSRERTSLVAPGRLEDWQRLSRSFAAIAGTYTENVTDTSGEEPERLEGRRVTPRFFRVYGVPPLVGRHFTDEEESPNGPGAAIISETFWARRFNRSPDVRERALLIGGRSFQIVGVMPARFSSAVVAGSQATDVWLPAQFDPGFLRIRDARFLGGVGRLRAGISIDEAARELATVQEALGREYPGTDAGWSVELRSLKDARIGGSRRGLWLLFAAVAIVWLTAVANIAGLALVQIRRRGRELAIRTALGASRTRVLGTLMREAAIVAILGGAAGTALAWWLVSLMPVLLPRTPRITEVALDWRALAFVGVTTMAAAGGFAIVPALAQRRLPLAPLMAAGGRSVTGSRHRGHAALVVAQVAASVLLVGSASLLLRSYYELTRVDTGFDAEGAYTFHVAARWDEDRVRIRQMQIQLLERLSELPHVQAAGMTNFLPATGATLRYQVRVEGLSGQNADGTMTVGTRMIGGQYPEAIRARLLMGGWCPPISTAHDGPPHALVNRRFVELFAPGQNLVGRKAVLTLGNTSFTIAGVVDTFAEDGPGAETAPYFYTCSPAGGWPDPEYVVRTTDGRALAADLRRVVREIDPTRAIFGFRAVSEVVDAAFDGPRSNAALLAFFACAALALAALGLYSLFMLVVSDRGREMAVRLAVGAKASELVGLVVAGAARLLAAGIVTGLALTAFADRALRSVLFGVSPLDPAALAASVAALVLVAGLAITVPAIRASRVSPVDALRAE